MKHHRSLRTCWYSLVASANYLLLRLRTPAIARDGMPGFKWWRAPQCAVTGHDWVGPLEIVSWRLQHCERCGEEIAHRTRWTEIQARETPLEPWEEAGWFGFDGPADHEDLFPAFAASHDDVEPLPASLSGLVVRYPR